jgi:transposase
VTQDYLFQPAPSHRLDQLSKEELVQYAIAQEKLIKSVTNENNRLKARVEELKQKVLFVDEQFIILKNKIFGKSSERECTQNEDDSSDKVEKKTKKTKVQLPSQRYPDAELIERHVELQEIPTCSCCGTKMHDTGMTQTAEFLTVIPKQYIVVRQIQHKYGCGKCHGEIKTAPAPKRIIPGSSMSDAMVIDVGLTKYCDLIPIERYAAIAGRGGLEDLPPQSLIESTHNLADFVDDAYKKLKQEILNSKVLHADETPHRMLEGDKKSNWFLWGFSTKNACYFDIRDTRSGDIASKLLTQSKCEYLISDVYSGYGKAVRDTNDERAEKQLPLIRNVYCNAHSRRKFKEAKERFADEAKYFIEQYKKIYELEEQVKACMHEKPENAQDLRSQMIPIFEDMKNRALETLASYSAKSTMSKALSYFLKNFDEFTMFTKNIELPIDNNPQERLLRNPVVGRKTWYGTHSQRGAITAAILFSLVESCKLNGINPRQYFKKLVDDIHAGKPAYTPAEYKAQESVNT